MDGDLVATWDITLSDGIHRVEFSHGTLTGKRLLRVDGKDVVKKDWMFKLVGKETFTVGKANCSVSIEPCGNFAYQYTLEVNGKSYQKFSETQSKILQMWSTVISGNPTRICLEKDTLSVFVNGKKVDSTGEFVDNGTETHFEIDKHICKIHAQSSGKRRKGILHQLQVDSIEIPPDEC